MKRSADVSRVLQPPVERSDDGLVDVSERRDRYSVSTFPDARAPFDSPARVEVRIGTGKRDGTVGHSHQPHPYGDLVVPIVGSSTGSDTQAAIRVAVGERGHQPRKPDRAPCRILPATLCEMIRLPVHHDVDRSRTIRGQAARSGGCDARRMGTRARARPRRASSPGARSGAPLADRHGAAAGREGQREGCVKDASGDHGPSIRPRRHGVPTS
jgi:hypothetical protein